jgi:dienelactone hydrolase
MIARQLSLAALCIALAACSSAPKGPPDLTPELESIAATGYVPERRHDTVALHEIWERDVGNIDVSFIAPRERGPFPLIVYLPGLGESSAAGALWRSAWAQAGYAVLALQPEEQTEQVWASQLAREGEFRALARQQFSAASAERRIAALDYALGELKRRIVAGASPYAAADTSRIVLAGFDLGAQTASLAAGEKPGGRAWRLANAEVRAIVVLSPFFDGGGADTGTRFAAMTLPVLCITGTADSDLFALVRDAAQRQLPWEAMPAGEKYLLLLRNGGHAVLAGGGLYAPGGADALLPAAPRGGEGSARRGRRGGGGQGSAGQFDAVRTAQADGAPQSGARSEARRDDRGGRASAGPQAFNLRQVAAIRALSTAFLDATVKQNATARTWLGQSARAWLGDAAVLKSK